MSFASAIREKSVLRTNWSWQLRWAYVLALIPLTSGPKIRSCSFIAMERERPKLSLHEAQMFSHYGILAPPLARLPAGFELSYAGVPVAPLLRDNALARQIEERCRQLSERKRAMARYSRTSAY